MNSYLRRLLLWTGSLGCGLLLSGCFSSASSKPTAGAVETRVPVRPVVRSEPVLYGRDGQVVSGTNGTASASAPTHGLEGTEGSRMYLLELYQLAIDEKEGMQLELEAVNAALLRAQEAIGGLETERQELRSANANLVAEHERMAAREVELAGRLATAQIGRLEAERLLLEAKIQWQENQNRVGGTGATAPASGEKP